MKNSPELEKMLQGVFPDVPVLAWIGSLAHGGFSEKFSDLDVALLYPNLPAAAEQEKMLERARAALPEGGRWSFFWSDFSFSGGRFPVPDRVDLHDHGIFFKGGKPPLGDRPGREALRAHLSGHSIPFWRELAAEKLPSGEAGEKQLVRLALYPARFAYSWDTGEISSNEAAVEYAVQTGWPLDKELLRAALDARNGGVLPGALKWEAARRQIEKVLVAR